MADEDYMAPHALEFYASVAEVHGGDTSEVLRQYRVLAESCPLVLKDLEIYCYGRESTYAGGDPYAMHLRAGMRAAYLRVETLAGLDDATIDTLEGQHEELMRARAAREQRKRERDMDRRLDRDYPAGPGRQGEAEGGDDAT